MTRPRRRRVSRNGSRRRSEQSGGSISAEMARIDYYNSQMVNSNDNQPVGEDSAESEDDELPILPRPSIPDSELSPQYWFLLKVVKYIKVIDIFLWLSHNHSIILIISTTKVWKSYSDLVGFVRIKPLRSKCSNVSTSVGEFRGY